MTITFGSYGEFSTSSDSSVGADSLSARKRCASLCESCWRTAAHRLRLL